MNDSPFEMVRPMTAGLVFALLALLFGFCLGVAFGLAEDSLKAGLQQSATAVADSVYQNDTAKMKAITDKSWDYYKRAHLHAGALGANAMAMILLMAFLTGTPMILRSITALALGIGALGYSVFWLWAGMIAPEMGSTGDAKESLAWLAMPTGGAVVAGTVAVLIMLLIQCSRRPTYAATAGD